MLSRRAGAGAGVGRAVRWLALGGALLTTGCPTPPPPSQFPSASDALRTLKQTHRCANGVQGEGKIDHVSPRGRIRGEVYIFAVNPDRVRFDVISPFGAMLYTLTSNGETFRMLDVKEKRFLHGPATACNLARLTQVPVPGHVLVSLLRGEAPLLVHRPEQAAIAWDSDGFYRVELESTREARQQLHLEVREEDFLKPWAEQRLRLVSLSTEQRGVVLYRADLSDHEPAHTAPPREDPDGIDDPIPPSGGACDAEVPRTIRIVVPHADDDVEFHYQKVSFNPPIPEGAFSQPVPGGVRQQYVDCR
jgi:outer membrane lipoprotein-sorting protein